MLIRSVAMACAAFVFLSPPVHAGWPQAPAAAHSATADAVVAALQSSLPELMRVADVPGMSAAVVSGEKLVWTGAFGVANAETGRVVDDATVFEAASLTKPVVAFGALALVDAGKLDLDKPLTAYLPGPYVADERAKLITARHVLSHTTGFPNWRRPGSELATTFTPGERFSYSGEGFVYLQKAIETITGEPLENYMRRAVFESLGMRSSSLVWLDRYDAAKTHRHDAVGELVGRHRPEAANAAASLQTTVADYGRFVAAVLGRRGLEEASFAEMLRPQVWVAENCLQCPDGTMGPLSKTVAWGLGWGLERTERGAWFWHWGDNGPAKAFVIGGGPDRIGVVVFANADNGLAVIKEALRRALGGERPLFTWLKVAPYDAPSRLLLKGVLARGKAAVDEYRARRAAGARISEDEMNSLGYALMRKNRLEEAIEVFRLNAEEHPASANVHDSLGEGYAAAGERELAVASYRRVLEIAPGHKNATAVLARLEAAPAARVAPELLAAYAGTYDTPAGQFTVTLERGRLFGGLAGYGRAALVAHSLTTFETLIGDASVQFSRDAAGRVTQVTIKAGGQTIVGERRR
jgi:CubicO group peptidase (beta-lactamase class C family)